MTKELAKTLTTALVQWIERERPKGTVCCSNAECKSIEQMFEGDCYDVIESFIKKKLEVPLTPFQQCLNGILRKVFFAEVSDPTSFIIKCIQDNTKELLALAKKELLKLWNENMKDEYARGKRDGITIGYNKAMKEYNESVAYHYDNDLGKKHLEGYILGREDTMREMKDFIDSHFNCEKAKKGEPIPLQVEIPNMPTTPSGWGCDGTYCTNPHMDCINCPRQTTGGTITTPNTNSGTSTLKAEG